MTGEDVSSSRAFPVAAATQGEKMLVEWAAESYKGNLAVLADALQRMVTLDAALLGGTVLLAKDKMLPGPAIGIAAVAVLASLGCAVVGSVPYGDSLHLHKPAAIRAYMEAATAHKRGWLLAAVVFMVAGFVAAFMGVVFRAE